MWEEVSEVGNLLKSEWLKWRFNHWNWLIVGAGLVLVPAMTIFLNASASIVSLDFVFEQILQSFYLGQAASVALAVLFMGQELSKSSLRTSLLTCPKRWQFFLAKHLVLLIVQVVFMLLMITLAVFFAQSYYAVDLLGNLGQIFPHLLAILLASLTFSLLSACLVFLVQSMILVLGMSLALLLGLGQMLLQFSPIFRNLPVLLSMNSFYLQPLPIYYPIWQGLALQFLWCLIVFILAGSFLSRKSIR